MRTGIFALHLEDVGDAGDAFVGSDLHCGLDAHLQLAIGVEALVATQHPLLGGGVDDGGDAIAVGFVERLGEACVDLAVRIVRQQLAHQLHGALAQHTRRIALRIHLDATALRRLGMCVDAGGLQRRRVHPGRMAVGGLDISRAVAGNRVKHRRRGVWKGGDIPHAGAYPRALRQRCQARLDRCAQRVLVGGAAEVDVLRLGRAPDQVVVRILEARQHQRAGQVVDLGARQERRDVIGTADRCDAAIDHGNGARLRLCRVHGEDAGAAQHQRLAIGKRRAGAEQQREGRGQETYLCRHSRHGSDPPHPPRQGIRRRAQVKGARDVGGYTVVNSDSDASVAPAPPAGAHQVRGPTTPSACSACCVW